MAAQRRLVQKDHQSNSMNRIGTVGTLRTAGEHWQEQATEYHEVCTTATQEFLTQDRDTEKGRGAGRSSSSENISAGRALEP